MRSDTLSEFVNLGGAYAALRPNKSISETTNHFLTTLWFSEDIQKGSIQLSGSLTNSTGFEGKTFNYSRNTLLFLNSKYNNQEARKSSTIESWLSDVIFYTQLENSLKGTDFVNDISGFLNSGDDGTKEEKDTDEAIGRLIEGATATGKNNKPLPPGQTTPGSTKNYVKPGDSSKDFDDFANDLGAIKETSSSPRGPVKIIDIPDGGTAANYPKSTSTGDPTISISPSRGRGFGRFIEIRYDGGQANIYIPVRG